MSRDEEYAQSAIRLLKELQTHSDAENAKEQADEIVADFLRNIGYDGVADEYLEVATRIE